MVREVTYKVGPRASGGPWRAGLSSASDKIAYIECQPGPSTVEYSSKPVRFLSDSSRQSLEGKVG